MSHLGLAAAVCLDSEESSTYLDTQFFHGLGQKKASNGCNNGPLSAGQHYGLPLINSAVDHDDIDCGSHAMEGLHLKHRETVTSGILMSCQPRTVTLG